MDDCRECLWCHEVTHELDAADPAFDQGYKKAWECRWPKAHWPTAVINILLPRRVLLSPEDGHDCHVFLQKEP